MTKLQVRDADEMHALGIRIGEKLQAGDLVVLVGPLGAGKTTLTRGVGEALGAIGNVSSPTFVIARTHKRVSGEAPMVHVDAYRLGSADELDDLDIDFPKSIVLVEWGKGMLDGINENLLEVEIERDHTGASETREVTITGFGNRWNGVSF
jgi:tRNA threonylcarbamoyl adenosine modification protein YjeE